MKRRQWIMGMIATMAVGGLAVDHLVALNPAYADAPSTRPVHGNAERPHGNPDNRNVRNALRAVMGPRAANITYTPQEWAQVMDFLRENSPARYHVLLSTQIEENSPIKQDLIRKWRNYKVVKEQVPAAAETILKRIKLEDDLFALVVQAKSSPNTDFDEYRERVRAKEAELVQLDFDAQQERIDKLEQLLGDQKSRLAAAEAGRDQLIDERTNRILGQNHRPTTRPNREGSDGGSVEPSGPIIGVETVVVDKPAAPADSTQPSD